MLDVWPNYRALRAKADADEAVLHDLYFEVSSVRADTVAGMLTKLRLVVEWQCMEDLDAYWPTVDEATSPKLELPHAQGELSLRERAVRDRRRPW